MQEKRVTMQDVADYVGVTKVTVSKAIAGRKDISDAMKNRILEAAKELGYIYNSKGRTLKENLNYTIGIITAERYFGVEDYFYLDLYKLMNDEMDKSHFTAMFYILNSNDEKTLSIPRMVLEQKIDGLIILGQISKDYLKELSKYNYATVFLDFYSNNFNVDSVITDNFFATYELTNKLIERGHKEIGFIGNLNVTSSIQDRYLGYYKAMLENNLEIKKEWIVPDKSDDNQWIDIDFPKKPPTAFVCNCDKAAYITIKKLNELGYSVPSDISVVGFDDSIHARLSSPKITTVRVNIEEMARVAIDLVVKRIKQKDRPSGRILIKGLLVDRESVKRI